MQDFTYLNPPGDLKGFWNVSYHCYAGWSSQDSIIDVRVCVVLVDVEIAKLI